MNESTQVPFLERKHGWVTPALALVSSVLLIVIFPPFGATWFAPVALTPLLMACALEASWTRRALLGWLAGVVYWCGLCPWIQFVLEVHGDMGPFLSWFAFLLFGLYKGLAMALFAALAGLCMNRWWTIPATAALWSGIERLHVYTGFAWLHLGNAATTMPLPMRIAPFTGIYGISFLLAMLSGAVAVVLLRRRRRELAWLLCFVVLLFVPRAPRPTAASRQALVVQPNVDPEMRWTRDTLDLTEHRLALLSKQPGADLLLWPEVPAPFYIDDKRYQEYLQQVARDAQAPFVSGVVGYTADRMPLNSAVMVAPDGKIVDRYDKMYLVPFGEFIPPLFSWVNRITQESGDFSAGNRVVVFPVTDPRTGAAHKAGGFICYESAVPNLVREFTNGGAEVLLNLSNDGYFGHSAAHEQHLLIARMRAAENRRWLIRATNDGITVSIDPAGRIAARLKPFEQTAGMLPFDYSTEQTTYTRYGDWFAWSCLAVGLALSVSAAAKPV
ncbi:MAG: apolipoprotein N-acyltransferase [Bryobacteraceae bacterium]